jgi:hypothetical protein
MGERYVKVTNRIHPINKYSSTRKREREREREKDVQ